MSFNMIGLDATKAKALAEKLNELLANYQIFYMNTRGFHWNVKGEKFFELHTKFEELYDDSVIKVDEIAERVLTLGETPLHSFNDYYKVATLNEATNITDGNECVTKILEAFSVLLPLEREILSLAGDADDEGTVSLMSDYISEQEKLVWMYSSFLKK